MLKGKLIIKVSFILFTTMIYVKVQRKKVEDVKERMFEMGNLEDNYKIMVDDKFGYIPIKKCVDGYEIVEFEGERRKKILSPYEKIKELFPLKNYSLYLPEKWEKYGDILLIKLPDVLNPYKDIVGETYSKVLNVKTVINYKKVKGELREPEGEIIYGKNSETIHLENGIYYKFDALKIMFSSGNVDERIRMSKLNFVNNKIVDMFAGIGYFSLPIAKYSFPEKVIAIEKNPTSFEYLLENIRINNINNIIPIFGDNRNIKIKDWADVVIMGYIHTKEFIPYAINMLNKKGILIYHDTFRKDEIKNFEKIIENIFGNYQFHIIRKHILKSYAPSIYHVVLDIFIRKV
ncbi:MAG: class I SAM-dependent methyltransferase [Thermoplasmata archaeon]